MFQNLDETWKLTSICFVNTPGTPRTELASSTTMETLWLVMVARVSHVIHGMHISKSKQVWDCLDQHEWPGIYSHRYPPLLYICISILKLTCNFLAWLYCALWQIKQSVINQRMTSHFRSLRANQSTTWRAVFVATFWPTRIGWISFWLRPINFPYIWTQTMRNRLLYDLNQLRTNLGLRISKIKAITSFTCMHLAVELWWPTYLVFFFK